MKFGFANLLKNYFLKDLCHIHLLKSYQILFNNPTNKSTKVVFPTPEVPLMPIIS